MNILLLNWRDSTHPKSGGAEFVTREHCTAWVKKGHSVTWFTAWYSGAKQEEKQNGIKIIRRGGSKTVYLSAIKYIFQHSNEFDVIVDEFHGLPFLSPLLTRKPVVGFIHEVAGRIWDYMQPFPINIIGKLAERIIFLFYRHCLFWTDAPSMIPELVQYGIPKSQITTIPCPLTDVPRIKRIPAKENSPTLIFLNRVVPMKGISDVLIAFNLIRRTVPNAKLWVVGYGDSEYIRSLKEKAKLLNIDKSLTWWGKVTKEEKFSLLSKAHLLVHASIKEGWGLVVLEAASVGTPSVVYPVSGLVDVVKHNKTGIVCERSTPESLALSVLELLDSPVQYKKFQQAGKEWVGSLSWKDATEQSLTLLLNAIERHI